jgi:hypothetical protein
MSDNKKTGAVQVITNESDDGIDQMLAFLRRDLQQLREGGTAVFLRDQGGESRTIRRDTRNLYTIELYRTDWEAHE